jgi:hypothetical protein
LSGFPWKVFDNKMAYPSTKQNCPLSSVFS